MTSSTPSPLHSACYAFGPFLLDPREHRLLKNGTPVAVTRKVLDTLLVLIEQRGRLVDKQELMTRLWPDAFVQDAALARHISDLRRILGEPARGGQYIETVPTRGYRFIADVSSVSHDRASREVSDEPNGVPALAPAILPAPATPTRAWRGLSTRIAASVALIAVAAGVAWSLNRPVGPTATVRSIAVVPFRTSENSENERILAQGLADSLISRLVQIPGLGVRPIGAVRTFGESTVDPQELGRRLRVDAVLTGDITRDGSALEIRANLIDVADGRLLWSATFADAGGGLFGIEQAIAVQLSRAILPIVSDDAQARLERRRTESPDANRAYLRGRYFWGRRTRDGLERAVASLEQAVQIDPAFSLGHAGLSDAYLLLSGFRNEAEMIPRARAAALKALALDPSLGEAHAALGLIAMNYDWDWRGAEREFQAAIRLSPQYATAHHWHGEYLAYMGRFDEALAEIERAAALDPLSLIIGTDTGKILILARRYDEAIASLRRTLELDPSYPLARAFLAVALSAVGDHSEAIRALQVPGQEDDLVFLTYAASVHERAGDQKRAKAAVARLVELSKQTYVSPFLLAYAHIGVGDFDAAFEAFDRMCAVRGLGAIAVKVSPLSDPIRHDPRFAALLTRLGFAS
jgi:DNA-binding winged helix-turn-helix (wHTH) protein/TolB-like protein/Flp pilus assembly protein TadD